MAVKRAHRNTKTYRTTRRVKKIRAVLDWGMKFSLLFIATVCLTVLAFQARQYIKGDTGRQLIARAAAALPGFRASFAGEEAGEEAGVRVFGEDSPGGTAGSAGSKFFAKATGLPSRTADEGPGVTFIQGQPENDGSAELPPGPGQPQATQPGDGQPQGQQTGADQLQTPQPGDSQPQGQQTDNTQPQGSQPDNSQTETTQPDDSQTKTTRPMIAFTFDDGPYTPVDSRILDVLEAHGGRATFFVVGNRVNNYTSGLKRIAETGNEIGNHTFDHKNLEKLAPGDLIQQIESTNDAVEAITGSRPRLVRVPYGAFKGQVTAQAGYPLIQWDADTEDWKSKDKDQVVQSILSHAKDGSIILMHDLYPSTAEAVEEVVPLLVEQGFQLVTVSELYNAKGAALEPGNVYFGRP